MKIETSTIVRTVILALALINQWFVMVGMTPVSGVDQEALYSFISTGITIVMSIMAWWKNNSFTQPAVKADVYMKELGHSIWYRVHIQNKGTDVFRAGSKSQLCSEKPDISNLSSDTLKD